VAKTRLTRDEIERIIEVLTSWQGKLSWDLLLARVKKTVLRRPFTRQGLAKQENILAAYQLAKERLRAGRPAPSPLPPELELMQNTIISLRGKIAVLESERGRFEEKFATWLHNARGQGISVAELNRPLPKADRDRSDKSR
jgi:hypothetical protein